ncbi:naked cuticle [Microdochium nivale]|nr:naked cuticle [Microdochium nivale]
MQGENYLATALLPSAVQTRLPVLRALRKSISWTETWIVPVPRLSRSWPSSTRSTPPTSPPLDAITAVDGRGLELALPSASVVIAAHDDGLKPMSGGTGHAAHQKPLGTTPITPPTPMVQQDGSGVKWKYAQQGSMIHALGAQQGGSDAAFTRKSYIDGMSYLLKALPEDLDEHEASIIEQSLPAKCLGPMGGQVEGQTGAHHHYHHHHHPQQSRHNIQGGEALVRRAIRKAALQLVLLAYLFAKLITVLVRVGAQCEKRYNISHHIISQGVSAASVLGRYGVSVSSSVAQVGEGRLGQTLTRLGSWTANVVADAVREGFREGLEIISSQPEPSQKSGW